uniref:Uncharacterized protein n=1 Tax=Trypanosoma vivax (strain Y486) TaxID=1055687 RepID=G0TXP7_TRYVY|nr:conserved hypothetical protein [Trypanosoma vivax Y486]
MNRQRPIQALLRSRLSTATLSPLAAAQLLCALHPCMDSGVEVHLVGRVEGNGLLLTLPIVISLIRRAYLLPLRSERYTTSGCFEEAHDDTAPGVGVCQWGPMEETIFTTLCIRFKWQQQQGTNWLRDIGFWNNLLPAVEHCGACVPATEQGGEMIGPSCVLEKMLMLLYATASFVHRSTLTKKDRRLRLLLGRLFSVAQHVEEEGARLIKASADKNIASLDCHKLQRIGLLAARCLRLYRGLIAPSFKTLFDLLLLGMRASRLLLQERHGTTITREMLRTVHMACDMMLEMRSVLSGVLMQSGDQVTSLHSEGLEQCAMLLEAALQLAESSACIVNVVKSSTEFPDLEMESERSDDGAKLNEIRGHHVAIVCALAACLRIYDYACTTQFHSLSRGFTNIVTRGLHTLKGLVQEILSALPAPTDTLGASSQLCNCTYTFEELGDCFVAAQVLFSLSLRYDEDSKVTECDGATPCCLETREGVHLRARLLCEALCHLNCFITKRPAGGGADFSSALLLTVMSALHAWVDIRGALYSPMLDMLWEAVGMALPRHLHTYTPPLRVLLGLLELCGLWLVQQTEPDTWVTRIRTLRDHCMVYALNHYCASDSCGIDFDFFHRFLHIVAEFSLYEKEESCSFTAATDLFANHPLFLRRFMDVMLPVDRGMRRLFGQSFTSLCENNPQHCELEMACNNIDADGAWSSPLCGACMHNLVWHRVCPSLGSPSTCCCKLRRCGPAETLVAYVEAFLPLLCSNEQKQHRGAEPLDKLRAIFQEARAITNDVSGVYHNAQLPLATIVSSGGKGKSKMNSPAVLLLIECHNVLLLLPRRCVPPLLAIKILRTMYNVSPVLCAHVPQLPQYLLGLLTSTVEPLVHVYEKSEVAGSSCVTKRCTARQLYELFIWASAADVAHAGRSSALNLSICDEVDARLSRAVVMNGEMEEEDSFVLSLLHSLNEGEGHALRQAVLEQAIQLARIPVE